MPRTRAQIPQRIAALVASAIANVQARSELEASRVRIVTTADEARRRVMRDLHDGSQRGLSHSRFRLGCLRSLGLRGTPASTPSFEALTSTAQGCLRNCAQSLLGSTLPPSPAAASLPP
jgi:signal transduction histidine kinase